MGKVYNFKNSGEACHNCRFYGCVPASELNDKNFVRYCSYCLSIKDNVISDKDIHKLNLEREPGHWCTKYKRLQSRKISDLHKVFSRAALKGCRDFMDDEKSKYPLIKIDEKFIFAAIRLLNSSKLKRKQDKRTLDKYVLGNQGLICPVHIKYCHIFKFAESLPDTYLKSRTILWGDDRVKAKLVHSSEQTFSRFLKGFLIFLRWYGNDDKYPVEPSEFSAYVDPQDYGLNSEQRAVILSQNAVNSVSLNTGDFERYVLRLSIKEMSQGRVDLSIELFDYLLSLQGFFQTLKDSRLNPKVLILRSVASAVEHNGPAALQYLFYLPDNIKNRSEFKRYIRLCESI